MVLFAWLSFWVNVRESGAIYSWAAPHGDALAILSSRAPPAVLSTVPGTA